MLLEDSQRSPIFDGAAKLLDMLAKYRLCVILTQKRSINLEHGLNQRLGTRKAGLTYIRFHWGRLLNLSDCGDIEWLHSAGQLVFAPRFDRQRQG